MWLSRKQAGDDSAAQQVHETHEKALDDLARTLLAQEHASLRSEILASYDYAQSIVRWTLATVAAIVAAGLIATNDATGANPNTVLAHMLLPIFGLGLPVVVWLYSYTWLGELIRAERAGSYLRALEASVSGITGLNDRLGLQPLRWESFIWANREVKRSPWGKQVITYLGTAGAFVGCALAGPILLGYLVWNLVDTKIFDPPTYWWLVGSIALNLICGVLFSLMCEKVFALGKRAAPLDSSYGDVFSQKADLK